MALKDEIFEQPDVLQSLLETQWHKVQTVAQAIRQHDIRYIFLAARGTSDNAGLYSKYLWGIVNRQPIALAAPSLFSLYEQPPKLRNALVLGVSQSGQSPDIISVIEEGRRQGNLTLAITNDASSPLAGAAELVLDISAGAEKAIAATKSYTAQLMTIAMLSAALADDADMLADLHRVPTLVREVLTLDDATAKAAEHYQAMDRCIVLGRGYNYATACEWSLKMKEMAYIIADPYSSADFRHGPIAIVSQGFPVLAVVARGAVSQEMTSLLGKLHDEHQAELLVIANQDEALSYAHTKLKLPDTMPEWLSPIITIIPGQLFSYHLTQAKGFDVEAPRGLSKVTLTN